jgi:hypothetical protein
MEIASEILTGLLIAILASQVAVRGQRDVEIHSFLTDFLNGLIVRRNCRSMGSTQQ